MAASKPENTNNTKNEDAQTEESVEKPPVSKQEKKKVDAQLADEILSKISIHRGSITDLHVDCIVNAANGGLWAGAGVCGVIFRAAGYGGLQRECDSITDTFGDIPTGRSIITKGYKLFAKHIIHSVGPTSQNNEALSSCYATALDLCILHDIKSIAFPCISTGIFGFSKAVAAPLALKTVQQWLIAAKDRSYKAYVEELKEKQKVQNKEALERKKKNRWRYSRKNEKDSDDDDSDLDDNNDKNSDNDRAKTEKEEEVDSTENDKSEVMDTDNGDEKKKQVENNNEDNDNDEETVFDRIENIIFCCYDIGNWHLYKDQTPKIFPSSNAKHNYLWSDRVNNQKTAKKKADSKSKKETTLNTDSDHED